MNQTIDRMPVETTSRWRRRAALIAACLIAVVAVIAWQFWPHPGKDKDKPATPVDAGNAIVTDFPIRVAATASVQPINATDIKVRVDGSLQRIAFVEGQDVKAGQVLAQLDQGPLSAQLDQAQAALHKDQASLADARLNLQRYTKLAPIGAATGQQVDTAKATVDELQASVEADAAVVRSDRLQLGFTTLAAPFDGRVGAREANLGAIVHPGDATGIVMLTQMAPIDVQFSVSQDVLNELLAQQKRGALPVTVTAHGGGAELAQGSLAFVDSHVDAASGQIMLKALFRNTDRKLWPGELVDARILLRTEQGRVAVPSRALMHTSDGDQVYVIAQGKAQLRPVQTGVTVNGLTEINHGVQAGDTVVFDGQSRLNPGMRVKVHAQDARAAAAADAATPVALEQS